MHIPRILIGAAGSGSGKTLLTCALLAAFQRDGKRLRAFKCGPDYIDPMFHRTVLHVPSENLDTFFTGEGGTRRLFLETAEGADLAVMEGVMGLYDGLGGIRKEGSSYHLAKATKTPVILVIDAHGMGRSVLPLIAGFLSYDTEGLIHGIILNRMTQAFYETIRPEIERTFPAKLLGYVPKLPELGLTSRHLGLKLPGEQEGLRKQLAEAAAVLRQTVDLGRLLAIADGAVPLYKGETLPVSEEREASVRRKEAARAQVKIAVARDEAFCFYYENNLRMLKNAGARLLFFSPLRDKEIPKEADALLLGGGYPELFSGELAENAAMLADVREKITAGLPTAAECGGFLYLHEELEDMEKRRHKMAGIVPGACFYTGRPVRFGYVELQEKKEIFLPRGDVIRGHEFHYFDSENNGTGCRAKKPVSGKGWDCIFHGETQWLGFPHLYYASNPEFVRRFLGKAKEYAKRAQTRIN